VQPTLSLPVSPAGRADGVPTAWLSASVHDLLPEPAARWWPAALRLSAGYRAAIDESPAELVVGFDLDARRLPGDHPAWRRLKSVLGHTRLPGPAIIVGAGGSRVAALVW
jgi:hypothetical protein